MELGLWESSQHEKGSRLILGEVSTSQPPAHIRTSTQTQQGEKKKKNDEIEENKLMNKSKGGGHKQKDLHPLANTVQASYYSLFINYYFTPGNLLQL